MKVYAVISRFKKMEDFTTVGVSSECYDTLDKAIEYCRSKLNEEELERHEKQVKRNLINEWEYDTENYEYTIKELKVV